METAGLRWHPEMWPMAKAMVRTVRPKAKDTPTWPMPRWTPAARTALPQPAKTSQKVPKNSAIARFERGIVSPALSCGVIFFCEKRTADRAREIDGAYCDLRMEHTTSDARTLLM